MYVDGLQAITITLLQVIKSTLRLGIHSNFKLNVKHKVSMAADSDWTETHYDLPELKLQIRQLFFLILLILILNVNPLFSAVGLINSWLIPLADSLSDGDHDIIPSFLNSAGDMYQ